MSAPLRRPALRYHGGKWKLAPWIIGHFPTHRVYVEPFGGGGSVLLRKARSYSEVYNDLDGDIVNLFRVLRDDGGELCRRLALTPFARDEFQQAYEPTDDPMEQARRTVARSFMGFGSAAASGRPTGFRANSNRSGTTPAHDWANFPASLLAIVERMQGVVIENRDAVECMRQHDGLGTLHYVDPPYVHDTRAKECKGDKSQYRREMSDADHESLAIALHGLSGMVIVSGYPCDLYNALFRGWEVVTKAAHADGARDRVECLWLNAQASSHANGKLFEVA